jgi:hypothetical protein
MRPMRAASALVLAAAQAVLLAACTSGAPAEPGKTSSTAMPGRTSIRTNGPPTLSSTPAAESVLPCGDYIDSRAPTTPFPVVLGVVALPTSPGSPALGTSLTGAGNGPLRLFAKTGLVVKPDTSFELIVPAAFTERVGIGWGGGPSTPSRRVIVTNCTNRDGPGWLAYAGGYWIDHPACVPIIVRAGGKQQTVHIGIGTPCPGQQPPQGPSQS